MVDNKGDTNATTYTKVTLPNVRSNANSLTSSSRGRSVKRSDIINQLTKDAMAEVQTARKLNNTQQSRRRGRSSDTTNKTLTRGRTTTTTTTTNNNNNRNGSNNNRNDGKKEMLNRGRSSRVNGPHHHRRQEGMQQQSRSSRDRSNSRRRVAVDGGGKQRSSSRPRVNNNIHQSLSSSSGGNGSGNRGRSVSRPRRLKDTQQKRSLSRGRRTRRDVSKESNVSRDDMSRGRLPSGGREGRHPNNNRRNSSRVNEPLNNKCNNNGSSPSIPRRRFSSRSLSPHSSPNQRCGEPRSPSIERLAGRTSKSPQKPLLLEEEEEEDKHNNKKRLLIRIRSNSRSRRNLCSKSPPGGGGAQSVTSYSTRPTTIGGITDKIRTNLRSRSKSLPPGGRRRRGGIGIRRRKKRSSSSSEEEERSDDESSGEEEQERRLVCHEEEGIQRRSHSQPPRRYNNDRRSQSQPRSLFDPERRCSRSPTRPNIIRRSRRRPYQQLHRSGTPGRSIARTTRNDPFSKNGSTVEIDFYNYIRRGTSPPSRLQRSSSQSTRSSSRGRRSQRQYNDDEPTTRLRSKSPYSTSSHRGDNGPGGNVTIMSNYTDQSRRRMSPSVAQAVQDVVSKTNESRRRKSAAAITSQTSRSGMIKSPAHTMASSSSTYSDESSTSGERNNDESKPSIHPLERQHSKLNTTSGQRLHSVDMSSSSSSSCRSDDEDGVKEEEGDDENSITPSFLESSDDETESEASLSRADSIEDDDNANDSMNEQIASKSVVSYKSHRSHRSAVGRRKNKTKEEQQHHQYAEDKMPIEITYISNDDKEKKNHEQPTQVIDMTRVNTALNKIKSMERMSETVSSGGFSSQQKFSSSSKKKKTTQVNKKKTKSSPKPKACKRHPPPPPPRRPPPTIENAISYVNYDKTAAAVPIPVMEISQQPPIQHDTYHLYQQQQQAPPMFIQQQPERVRTEQLQVYDQQEQQLEKKSNDWMEYSTGATRRDGGDNDKRKSKIKGRVPSRHADRQITQHVRQMPFTDQFGDFGYYTGQVDEDGRPDGKGSMKYDNGVFYEGAWTTGCQDQKAAANYERIRGGFTSWGGKGKSGVKSGMVLPWNARKNDAHDTSEKTNVRGMEWTDLNGDTGRYTGEVNNDQLPHGNGIMKYDFGLIAEGEWVNGVLKERPTDRMLGVAAAMNGGGQSVAPGIQPISSGMSIGPGANGFASGAVSVLGGGGISVAPRQQIGLAHPHQPAMQQFGGGGMNMNPMLAQMANQTGAVGAQQHAIMSQQNATMKSMYGGGGGRVYGGTPMQMMMHPQVQQPQMIMMPQQPQQQLQTQQSNLPPSEIELEM